MESDLLIIFRWWIYISLIGFIFLPFCKNIFNNFFDKGYLFAKIIGLAVVTYVIWLLSCIRIVPFGRVSILMCLVAAFIIIFILLKQYKNFIILIKENSKIFIIEELLFISGLIFWSFIRGLQPDIYGLEKFMDFGFVNSILRTTYMPPADIWLSGKSINYYYFGHYICAFLSSLSDIDSSIAYNLMIATIFSFTLCLTFSLTGNILYSIGNKKLKNIIIAGVISSLLLTFGGNLHTFIYATALPAAKSIGLYSGEVNKYFYADSTRYIGYNPPTNDKTIHEFPIYSFVVSDLHGHVSDIPFVITFLALLLAYITGNIKQKYGNLIFALFLSIFYMTNAWDYPIYLTVAFFVFIYKNFNIHGFSLKSFYSAIMQTLKLVIISQLLCLFYTLNFKNITQGVGLVYYSTPFYQLCVLWGYQFFLIICFIIFLVFILKPAFRAIKGSNLKTKISLLFLKTNNSDAFILILLASALGLVIMPEIVYVRDIYGGSYHRANTMFKLTYQSFIMFGICAGYIFLRIASSIRKGLLRISIIVIFSLILIMPMMYPFYAVNGYYGQMKISNYKGLYGLNFLEKISVDDKEAVKWLSQNVSGQPVILEANGESYSDYERISMATGLPTVLGWYVHEWLWRGGTQIPIQRASDVALIYESDDITSTRQIINKYDVSYIVIGNLERSKFKNINEKKIISLGKIVFESQGTMIVRLGR